jgi:hypothetical protein
MNLNHARLPISPHEQLTTVALDTNGRDVKFHGISISSTEKSVLVQIS